MKSDEHRRDDPPRPLFGAVYEGGVAFIATIAIIGVFLIREAIRGAHMSIGEALVFMVGIALVAGVFFSVAAFFRLRRSIRIRNIQSRCPENDALVANCVASDDDGLEDVTARIPAAPNFPMWVDKVLEERTWNVHRLIVFLRTAANSTDMGGLKVELANWIRCNLRGNWLRGVGLGVVLRGSGLQIEREHLYEIVDGCGGRTVIMQWFILVNEGSRRVTAVHMPIAGRTTRCFLTMLSRLADDGYLLEMAIKEKTGLYRKVSAVHEAIPPWLHALAPFLH